MPHVPPTLEDILDLTDPIDRQIFKLSLTVSELQATRGTGFGTRQSALDLLRLSAAGTVASREDEAAVAVQQRRFGGFGSARNISGRRIEPGREFVPSTRQLRTDLLGRKALQLFPSLVLPDFLKPLVLPEEDVGDPAAAAAAAAVADKQTFTTLFQESLTARLKDDGIGRAELVRDTP